MSSTKKESTETTKEQLSMNKHCLLKDVSTMKKEENAEEIRMKIASKVGMGRRLTMKAAKLRERAPVRA